MSLSAGTRLGPYEVLGSLGSGGMGEVYRARDTRLGREVAIKVLPAEVSSDSVRLKRFEKEARAASALNHPNIVTIYDVGSADSVSYITMERVEGRTLRELLLAGPLAVKKALAIAAQIADGLGRAHEAGIVHRDLKPENVMVARDGLVKILDFGLAKLTEAGSGGGQESRTPTETGTTPGTVLGTVGYMSPEQAAGQPADFRSDQFSFGSILYEMASGRRAFQRKTGVETLGAILNDEPEPIVRFAPRTPAPLAWIVDRCLAKDPGQRYSSTNDLARDVATLRERLADLSATREPTAVGRRSLRAWAVAAGALFASALLGVLAGRLAWRNPSAPPAFQRLTFRRGLLANARFAPDGQTVVYSAAWDGGGMDVYMTRIGGAESRVLLENADLFDVSGSGELAVMVPGGPRGMLARIPLTGGAPRSVAADINWGDAAWSPDGMDFAIVRSVGAVHRLEYPIGRVLYESPEWISAPRFSPRGDKIAFYESGRTASIAVLDIERREKKVLSTGWDKLQGGMPAWSPDGKEVWFTAAEPGRVEALWAVGLSGKARLVTRVAGILELFDISRDHRVLVGHHFLLSSLMCLAPGEAGERDLSWLSDSSAGDLSPDGKTVVITEGQESGGPAGAVYLRKTDGSPAVRLGKGDGAGLSPDGLQVIALVPPIGEKNARLTVLRTGAGETRTLIEKGFERFLRAAWLPDGKGIVFAGVEAGHAQRVYLLDVATGRYRAITPEGVGVRRIGAFLSPDGRLLLAVRGNESLLWPLSEGAPTPVAGLSLGDIPVQLGADGGSVFVFRNRATPPGIWLLDLRTGKWTVWKALQLRGSVPTSLFVTPDGRSYVCSYRTGVSTLYAIEGLR